jgi:hypothetical protein
VECSFTYLFKRSSGKGNAINYVSDILKKRGRRWNMNVFAALFKLFGVLCKFVMKI